MSKYPSSVYLQDPTFHQVRVRQQQQSHEYVVPSQFASIQAQPPLMKNAHRNYKKKKRFSLPPPTIREEDEVLFSDPMIIQSEDLCSAEDDEEDIPLAVLAYRKGFKVPVKPALMQHVYPSEKHQHFQYPHHQPYYNNPCFNSPTHSHAPSLYQLNDNSSLSFSPSSSNSSLSSLENTSRNSSSGGALKYPRRQSSHF